MRNQHSIILESLQFCLQTGKSLKFDRFESAQNFSCFFSDLKFVLFRLGHRDFELAAQSVQA